MPFDSDNLRDGVITEDDIRDGYRELELDAVMTPTLTAGIKVAIQRLQALLDDGYGHYPLDATIAESVASVIDDVANDLGTIALEIDLGPNTDETNKYSYR